MTKKKYVFYAILSILSAFVGDAIALLLVFVETHNLSLMPFLLVNVTIAACFVLPSFLTFIFVRDIMLKGTKKTLAIILWELVLIIAHGLAVTVYMSDDFIGLPALYISCIFTLSTIPTCLITALIYSGKVKAVMSSFSETAQLIIKSLSIFIISSIVVIVMDILTELLFNDKHSYHTDDNVFVLIFVAVTFFSITYALRNSKNAKSTVLSLILNVILSAILGLIMCLVIREVSIFLLMIAFPPVAFAITSLITLAVKKSKS